MSFRLLIGFLACLSLPLPALAQGAQVTFGGMRQDTSKPIEVSADALSVNQSDGTAVYSGNVVIGQGEMRLAAARVKVIYSADNSRIDRLDASGGVVLVNGSEAAEAERAIYNVQTGNIEMSGNVLLTQGNNALTANSMTVNLETGTAQMNGRVRTVLQTGDQ